MELEYIGFVYFCAGVSIKVLVGINVKDNIVSRNIVENREDLQNSKVFQDVTSGGTLIVIKNVPEKSFFGTSLAVVLILN